MIGIQTPLVDSVRLWSDSERCHRVDECVSETRVQLTLTQTASRTLVMWFAATLHGQITARKGRGLRGAEKAKWCSYSASKTGRAPARARAGSDERERARPSLSLGGHAPIRVSGVGASNPWPADLAMTACCSGTRATWRKHASSLIRISLRPPLLPPHRPRRRRT